MANGTSRVTVLLYMTVAAIGGAIITNLLGSGALEDLIRVVGVA